MKINKTNSDDSYLKNLVRKSCKRQQQQKQKQKQKENETKQKK